MQVNRIHFAINCHPRPRPVDGGNNLPPSPKASVAGGNDLKPKITFRIIITDPFHDISQVFHIGRQFSFFDIFTNEVAKYPPEIFVPGVGEEGSRIGQHSHEPAQEAHIRKGVELFLIPSF